MYCAFTVLFHGIGKNFIKMWTVCPFRHPGSTCWNVTSRICFTDFYKETWRSLADCNITERKAEPDWLKLRGLEWLAPKRQSKRPVHRRLCTTWFAEIRIKAKKCAETCNSIWCCNFWGPPLEQSLCNHSIKFILNEATAHLLSMYQHGEGWSPWRQVFLKTQARKTNGYFWIWFPSRYY